MPEPLPPASPQVSPRALVWTSLALAMLVHVALARILAATFPLDIDVSNLLAGAVHFNPAQHAPQPPGYLPYVLVLRAAVAVLGRDVSTAQLVASLWSAAGMPLLVLWTLRRFPQQLALAGALPWLWALSPVLLYHAADGQMHGAEAFAAMLLLWRLQAWRQRQTPRMALAVGLALALGGALRPSFLVLGLPLTLWHLRQFWRQLALALGVLVAGTLGWLLPTALAAGGWQRLADAQRLLSVSYSFAGRSLLSAHASPELVRRNLAMVLVISATIWLPVLAFAAPTHARTPDRTAVRALLLTAALPTTLFYLLAFCAEPGYLAGLVPVALCVLALRNPDGPGVLRGTLAALVVQMVCLAGPTGGSLVAKVPTVRDLIRRDIRQQFHVDELHLPPPGRRQLLLLSDSVDDMVLRSLPIVRPDVSVLMLVPRMAPGPRAWGLARVDGWLPIPGPLLGQAAGPTTVQTDRHFDVLVLDPLASQALTTQLMRQLRCPLGPEAMASGVLQVPVEACLPQHALHAGEHTLRFAP